MTLMDEIMIDEYKRWLRDRDDRIAELRAALDTRDFLAAQREAENAKLRAALAKYPEWVTTLRFENNVGQTIGVCLSCGNEKVKDGGKHKPDCLRQSAEVKP